MTLPTPPTLEQRLDAAVKLASRLRAEPVSEFLRNQTASICRAFAPEHFKDTDTTTGKD